MADALVDAPMQPVLRSDSMLSVEDFETASIRSAAPSYFSDAPSYHSIPPHPEALPPYTPRSSPASPLPSTSPRPRQGLPPVSSVPGRRAPTLDQFRVAAWPSADSNPNLRLYHNIAQRRMSDHRRYDFSATTLNLANRRPLLERVMETQEGSPSARNLEDPHVVGEEAASRARRARMESEFREPRQDPLLNEDLVWDRFMSQMRNGEFRTERSADRSRRSPEQSPRKSIFRRWGALGRFM